MVRRDLSLLVVGFSVAFAAPTLAEERAPSSRELAAAQSRGVLTCHRDALARGARIDGLVKITWLIDRFGKVVNLKIAKSTIDDAVMDQCILVEARSWKFPSRTGDLLTRKHRTYRFAPPKPKG